GGKYSLAASQRRVEALIDSLDAKGIIDRRRVGLSGFSSTCLGVKYFLTHSDYEITAALVADGADSGYFQYMLVGSGQGFSEGESQIGSAPFGLGLKAWLENSPGFLMDQIRTPMRIEANRIDGLAYQWEFYAGLRRLDKSVELYYYPQGSHSEVRVPDWLETAQGAVDWYRFWLLGLLPADPGRSEQLLKLKDKQSEVLARPKAPRLLWTPSVK
ncbi:MAG: alpha/beta hydrolase family protein, partial [Terriglobales bacterium]